MPEITREQAVADLWRAGTLAWKLLPHQVEDYHRIWGWILDPDCLKGFLNWNRRRGKSFVLTLICCEFAIRWPRAQIRAAAPTGDELREINGPIMQEILIDCPADLRPVWKETHYCWYWPNGSQHHIAGVNNKKADRLRGTGAHLALVDEAGFVEELKYVISSVLVPQLMTHGGTMLISSTPPRSPAHEAVKVAAECELAGYYIHRDIWSQGLPKQDIEKYIREAGGIDTAAFRREHGAEFVIDESLAVIPEWRSSYVQEVEKSPAHKFWHKYQGMDIGSGTDKTAVVFAYYDFDLAKLIVEDEVILDGRSCTTDVIANAVRVKEIERGYQQVHMRPADNNNLILLRDLRIHHDMEFFPTVKEGDGDNNPLAAMVNAVRRMVKDGRILVHPRCVNLIGCLKSAVWKGSNWIDRELDRSDEFGHFDALMALVYLVKNLDTLSNPVPANWGVDLENTQIVNRQRREPEGSAAAALEHAFGRRKRAHWR